MSGKGKDSEREGREHRIPGKETLRPEPPKRFFKSAAFEAMARKTEGGTPFRVLLDGRPLRTPAKHILALPTEPLTAAIAEEWQQLGTHVDPARLPLTRIANSAIDAVAGAMPAVRADVVAYAGSDLICYRAEGPPYLTDRQAAHWDPVLAWARSILGAELRVGRGVMPVAQSDAMLRQVAAALARYEPFALSAIHVLTTLSGSACFRSPSRGAL